MTVHTLACKESNIKRYIVKPTAQDRWLVIDQHLNRVIDEFHIKDRAEGFAANLNSEYEAEKRRVIGVDAKKNFR